MKKAIALLLVMLIGIGIIAGCGSSSAKLSGKYHLVLDQETKASIEEFSGGEVEWYIEFLSGDKCKLVIMGDSEDGTYKITDKSVEITVDGDSITAKIDGNKVIIDEDGEEMVYQKK